jgi:hypothetical protein
MVLAERAHWQCQLEEWKLMKTDVSLRSQFLLVRRNAARTKNNLPTQATHGAPTPWPDRAETTFDLGETPRFAGIERQSRGTGGRSRK